ncbi:MAG: arylsulfatase A-like enzyme [Planctomycetaceae bacterium]|jgi:arylsulfatase A-like enzyme
MFQFPLNGLIRSLILTTVFIAVPVAVSPRASLADEPSRRPNIVLLFADDLGYGELGCQGNAEIPTPNIDSIAADGIRFTSGYVTAPFCSASRAGLLTGRYQTRFGYEFNPIGADNEDPNAGLPPSQKTIANHLHDAGYTTGLIGKWHLGGTAKYHPYRRGFDEFFGFMHEGHYFVPHPYDGVTTMLRRRALPTRESGRWTSRDGRMLLSTHMGYDEPAYDANNPILRGSQPVVEHEYLTNALTREAVDFIDRNHDRPFFLYLSYNAVHSPLQGADSYMKKFSSIEDVHRRIFAAMLANMDDSVGSVLNSLKKNGLDENTLVFFISDNGGPTRELTSSNAPLRGEKGSVYEGGIRVPFMLKWPGKLKAGREYHKPVVSLDVFGTAAAVAEAPIPKNRPIDGVNLLPFLTTASDESPHNELFWRVGTKAAIRSGDWKLLRNPSRRQKNAEWELYNLQDDIGETSNLAAEQPARVKRLTAAWERLDAQMIEPVWQR